MRLNIGLVGLVPALLVGSLGCSEAPSEVSDENLGEIRSDLTLEVTRLGISAEFMPVDLPFPAGIASDKNVIFIGSPFEGRVVAYSRFGRQPIGELPIPSNGFALPFIMKAVQGDRVSVLDAGGFPDPTNPNPTFPSIHEYSFSYSNGTFTAELVRSISFEGLPIFFAEDAIQLNDGRYLLNDAVLGSIWIANTDGTIEPGIIPETFEPEDLIPSMTFCPTMPQVEVGGVPFLFTDSTVPGITSMAELTNKIYFTGSCAGAVYSFPTAALSDSRAPWERAADIQLVSNKPAGVEVEELLGLTNNPYEPNSPYLYAADALQLQIIRIDTRNGKRAVVGDNQTLFNFPSSMGFAPPLFPGAPAPLLTLSNQQHLTPILNDAITEEMLEPPFLTTITYLK